MFIKIGALKQLEYNGIMEMAAQGLHDDIFKIMQPYVNKDLHILDFGCGQGAFSQRLADAGMKVDSCDIDVDQIRAKVNKKIKLDLNWTEKRSMVVTAVLRTFTLGIGQIGTLFLVSMATIIGAGTVSVFSMAYNLQGVPLTVIGMSYSMAAFPTLSRLFVAGDTKKFLEEIIISARHIIFWSMPIIILFLRPI